MTLSKIHTVFIISKQVLSPQSTRYYVDCFKGLKKDLCGIKLLSRGYSTPVAPGSGAGKGGGAGGSVRESGGALGRYGAAQEEEYFFNKQREQIEKMKKKTKKEEDKPSSPSQK